MILFIHSYKNKIIFLRNGRKSLYRICQHQNSTPKPKFFVSNFGFHFGFTNSIQLFSYPPRNTKTETKTQKPKQVNRQNDTSIQSHSVIPIPHRFSHIIFYDPPAILSSPKSAFFGQTGH